MIALQLIKTWRQICKMTNDQQFSIIWGCYPRKLKIRNPSRQSIDCRLHLLTTMHVVSAAQLNTFVGPPARAIGTTWPTEWLPIRWRWCPPEATMYANTSNTNHREDNCFTLTPEGPQVHNRAIESTYCCLAFHTRGRGEMHMIKPPTLGVVDRWS